MDKPFDLTSLIKSRRSANKFIPGVNIPDEEFAGIFNLVKFAPSAFNLQHTHYIVVKDPDLKNKVYEAAGKQYKVQSASAVIVVLGNMDAYQEVAHINQGLLDLGVISKQEYDMTLESVTGFYEGGGDRFKRDEAIRNANLSAMLMMLVAKERGWDTCPMIGFDPEALHTALNIPNNYVPALLVAIGKEDTTRQRPRGYRKPVGEFVSFNIFQN